MTSSASSPAWTAALHLQLTTAEESGAIAYGFTLGMLSLLSGEFVTFSANKPDMLVVTGGNCTYELACSAAKLYLKPVLQCVSLQLRHNAVHAAACDGIKLMLVKNAANSPVNQEFLVPAESLQVLASISSDADVFEVGDIGGEIVFTKENMMFSARKIPGDFIDTSSIVKSVKPAYTAVAEAKLMREALNIISVGVDAEPVNIVFAGGNIILRHSGDYSEARTQVPANILQDTPDAGFFYNAHHLMKLFRVLDGKIRLELDDKGMMMVKSRSEVYVQTPVRAPARPCEEKESRRQEICHEKGRVIIKYP